MPSGGARLDVNGEIIVSPGEGDVSAAVDKAALQAGGHVTVTRPGGFFLEAAPGDEGGLLSLACGDDAKGQRQFATAPVTPAEAKALFSDFLDGGDAWRRQCRWRTRDAPAAAATKTAWSETRRSLTSWLAGGGAIAFMLMVRFVPVLLPAALALALCVFVAWKAWRETQVRRWPQANGRITASGLQPRRRRFRQEATRLDNIPALGYEFSVAGRRFAGSRLGLNTEYAGVDVGALVARCPVGASVPVFYNPSNPNDCLLDPVANKGLAGDALKLLATLGAFFAALYYGASAATHAVAAHFHNANAPHFVFAASFGLLFLLLFVWSFRRPRTAERLRASGAIVKSELEEVAVEGAGAGSGSYLQPTIEVAYSAGGQNYILRTAVGGVIAIDARVDAQERLAPYPVGKTVNVLYARDNPGASSLEDDQSAIVDDPTQTIYRVVALASSLACFAIATLALGTL